MVGNAVQQDQELKSIIEQSINESVDRAIKKYGRTSRFPIVIRSIICLLIILAVTGTVIYLIGKTNANKSVLPVANHDLTLENDGIFGFTVADFQEPILGKATKQQLLIVEEQEIYVNTKITDTGLFNWGVFNKQQALTIHGTGQYTIDLTQITAADISLNEDTYEITICIPHAELHKTIFDPSKTEVGDTQNGWLAFGEIKMTAEQQKEFETTAKKKLEDKLIEDKAFIQADRFAKLVAYETYQPIVKTISSAYKVVIAFK